MKDLLTFLFTSLADDKDKVEVAVAENDQEITASVKVAQQDMGKIIGKRGRTINSIRSVAKVLAVKAKKHLVLNLEENQGGKRREAAGGAEVDSSSGGEIRSS